MNLLLTDCEVDALTTTPSRRYSKSLRCSMLSQNKTSNNSSTSDKNSASFSKKDLPRFFLGHRSSLPKGATNDCNFLIWKGNEEDKHYTTSVGHKFHWLHHLQHLLYENFENGNFSSKFSVLWAVHQVESFHSQKRWYQYTKFISSLHSYLATVQVCFNKQDLTFKTKISI